MISSFKLIVTFSLIVSCSDAQFTEEKQKIDSGVDSENQKIPPEHSSENANVNSDTKDATNEDVAVEGEEIIGRGTDEDLAGPTTNEIIVSSDMLAKTPSAEELEACNNELWFGDKLTTLDSKEIKIDGAYTGGVAAAYSPSAPELDISISGTEDASVGVVCLFIDAKEVAVNVKTNLDIGHLVVIGKADSYMMNIDIAQGSAIDCFDFAKTTATNSSIKIGGLGEYSCPDADELGTVTNQTFDCGN